MADEVTSLDGASFDELIDLLRKTPGHLFKTAADSLAYLAAQDGLLSEAQEERDRARDELAETKRPLAEEMARLNCNLIAANTALADRDRRIEALVAEVDSWKASYMALAPDHDIAMTHANSRIEALTKALRELVACKDLKERFEKLPHERQEQHGHPRSWCDHCALQYEYEDRKQLAWDEARKLLAIAASGGAG